MDTLSHKRDLILGNAGRFCGVTFVKKDGSARVMLIQPAALKFRVKGDDASPAARQAAETRAARHPHLLPVWDVVARAVRSVNLETVQRIAAGGNVYTFNTA